MVELDNPNLNKFNRFELVNKGLQKIKIHAHWMMHGSHMSTFDEPPATIFKRRMRIEVMVSELVLMLLLVVGAVEFSRL